MWVLICNCNWPHITIHSSIRRSRVLKKTPPYFRITICTNADQEQTTVQPSNSCVVGSGRCWDRGITTKEKCSHHQKKFKRLFRNHAYFYSILQEVLDAEDEETERKVNSMEETQTVCFLLEETTNLPIPCLAKRNQTSAFSCGAGCQLGFGGGGSLCLQKKKKFLFCLERTEGENTYLYLLLPNLPPFFH